MNLKISVLATLTGRSRLTAIMFYINTDYMDFMESLRRRPPLLS